MNWELTTDDVLAWYRDFITLVTRELPRHDETARRMSKAPVSVDFARAEQLARVAGDLSPRYSRPADWLAAVMCEANSIGPLSGPQLSGTMVAELNANAAVLLTATLADELGVEVTAFQANAELQQALTAPYMSRAQRYDVVLAAITRAVPLTCIPRSVIDLDQGPVVSIGTPISAVDGDQQAQSLALADAVAEVVLERGWQPDVPGHRRKAGVPIEGDKQRERDIISRSSLYKASTFIAVNTHWCRRGLGYAVGAAEKLGEPILLLPGELEEAGFARVFRERFAHREEDLAPTADEARQRAREFLRDHEACIVARHERLLEYRERLQPFSRHLIGRLEAIDLVVAARFGLTPTNALFLAGDPVHLGQSQKWEVEELARVAGVQLDRALATVFGIAGATGASHAPDRSRGGATREGVLEKELTTWRDARKLHPGTADQWVYLLDEHLEKALATSTAGRRSRTDVQDWIDAFHRRFG